MNRPIREDQIVKREGGFYHLSLKCTHCQQPQTVILSGTEMYHLQTSDDLIQRILPEHSAGKRELFMSGICSSCWDQLFKDDEEDANEPR